MEEEREGGKIGVREMNFEKEQTFYLVAIQAEIFW